MKLLDLEIFHCLWFQMLNLTIVHICILEKIDVTPYVRGQRPFPQNYQSGTILFNHVLKCLLIMLQVLSQRIA